MPNIIAIDEFTHRVPAWKKLGLKLKYAKDNNNDGVINGDIAKSDVKKRKRQVEDHAHCDDTVSQLKSFKKLKKSSPTETMTHTQPDEASQDIVKSSRKLKRPSSSTTHSQPAQTLQDKPHSAAPTSPLLDSQPSNSSTRKRKSVAFTPDTKEKDGDSIKQLYNAWVDRQKAEDPQFQPEKVHQALKPQPSEVKIEKKAEKKLQKDRKSSSHPKSSDDSAPTNRRLHPAITYLLQYHRDRKQWKFNKAKQSYLLKHLLDLDRIPPEYDKALVVYIANLQSEAARARVKKTMEKADRNWLCPVSMQRMMDAARDADYWSHKTFEELEKDPRWQEYKKKEAEKRRWVQDAALERFVDALRAKDADVFNEGYSTELYNTNGKMIRKLDIAKRAEAILWALSEQINETVQDEGKRARSPSGNVEDMVEKRVKLNDGSAQRHVRKRKLRTNAVEEEDSESSESSPSSSEYFTASENVANPKPNADDKNDEESLGSSESSSDDGGSSSGSESESEEESDGTGESGSEDEEESDDDDENEDDDDE